MDGEFSFDSDEQFKEEVTKEETFDQILERDNLQDRIDIQKEDGDVSELPMELHWQHQVDESDRYLSSSQSDELSHSDESDPEWTGYEREFVEHDTAKFKCRLCGKSYSQKGSLNRHIIQHSNAKGFKCEKCGKQFFRRHNFQRHLSRKINCSTIQCSVCLKNFNTNNELVSHLMEHSKGQGEDAGQGLIESVSDQKSGRTGTSLNATESAPSVEKNSESDQGWTDDGKRFKCNLCGKSYSQKSGLYRHMIQHNNKKSFECSRCNKQFFRKYNLLRHMASQRKCKKGCLLCHKAFYSHDELILHLLEHYNNDNNKISNSGDNIKEVVDMASESGSSEEPDMVSTSASTAENEASFKEHSRSGLRSSSTAHTKKSSGQEEPLQCVLCDKSISTKAILIRHLYIHISVKPYKSKQCWWSFARKSQLARHEKCHKATSRKVSIRVKSANGDGSSLECDDCGKIYRDRRALNRHKITHSGTPPFQCTRCGKGFYRRYNLERHRSASSCKKRKPCKICGERFETRHHFINHIREHFDTPAEVCDICFKTFSNVDKLTQHKKSHPPSREYFFKCSSRWVSAEDLRSNFSKNSSVARFLEMVEKIEAGVNIANIPENVPSSSAKVKKGADITNRNSEIKTKNYGCDECGSSYSQLASLRRHKKQHANGGVGNFRCNNCGKTFHRKWNLLRHLESKCGKS